MDKKKSSQTKRSIVESTDNEKNVKKNQVKDKKQGKKDKLSGNVDNTNQRGNQSFYKDQKDSKNIVLEKDSDQYELSKLNKASINTIDLYEDSERKSLVDDDEGEWCVKSNNKKKTNNQSLSEEQKYQKNVQDQSKLSDSNSKQKKTHDNNNIESHKDEDTHKSVTKRGKRRRDKKKKKNSQNEFSDIDSSINDKLTQIKVHDGNMNVHEEDTLHVSINYDSEGSDKKKKKSELSDIDSSFDDKLSKEKVHDRNNINNFHGEDTPHLSVNNDSKGRRDKNKNKNSQKQMGISDIDSSTDDKLNQKKVCDGNKVNLYKEESLHLSLKYDNSKERKGIKIKTSRQSLSQEQRNDKNVQKQSKWSEKVFNDESMKQKKAHDTKNIESHKDSRKSEGEERWKDKYKNNNSQRKSRFSDACVIEEIDEDIFKLSSDYSLAHCVAEDLRMGAGIAVDFKHIFGGVGKLIDQKLKIGDVGVIRRHDQYAFYLITKKTSNGKPTMMTMEKVLYSLLNKMKEHNLTKLGIPKIGCGLDKLDWSETKLLIDQIFSGSGIHITVCVPSKLIDSKTPPRLKVYITPNHLWEMEAETIIILFINIEKICNKYWTDHIVDKVDAKYPFKENLLRDVKNKKLHPGDITCYNVKNEVIICMFTTDNEYYGSLENGFKTLNQKIKRYKYLAIESGPIDYPSDNFQHISWIVLIARSVICSSELWLCDVKQKNNSVYYDEYCRNVLPMNDSFQYNSPNPKYNRYNDYSRSSFSAKETSDQH